MPDCPAFDEGQFFQAESLRQSFGQVLASLAQIYRARGQFEQAIPYARRWLALDPLHEPAHQLLMQLYARTGQQAAALRQYEECVRVLDEALGIRPAPETSELYETIRLKRMSPAETRVAANAEVTPEPDRAEPGSLLPAALVGRQAEWKLLRQAWDKAHRSGVHMVTIDGEAGIGKTRLVEELLAWARSEGIATAYAHSYGAEGNLAYAPVAAILRSEALQTGLTRLSDTWLAPVSRLLPELLETRPHLSPPEPLVENWQRQQFFEALAHSLDELWARGIVRTLEVNQYDFTHDRIREVAYSQIGRASRALLHRRIAAALEQIYAANPDPVSGELAVHYEPAGLFEPAIGYYRQAATVAQSIAANNEAILLLSRGLALVDKLPEGEEKARQELSLRLALSVLLRTTRGWAASEVEETLAQAQALSQKLGQPAELRHVLLGQLLFLGVRARLTETRTVAKQLMQLSHQIPDPALMMEANYAMGCSLYFRGDLQPAYDHYQKSVSHYQIEQHHDQVLYFGANLGVFGLALSFTT